MKIRRIIIYAILLVTLLFPRIPEAESGEVTAKIAVTSDCGDLEGPFTYRLVPESKRDPVPEKSELVLGNETGVFYIPCFIPGDYHYRLFQEKGNRPDVRYDDTVYEVTLRVVLTEDEKEAAEVFAINVSTGKKEAVHFKNTKIKVPDIPGKPSIPVILGISEAGIFPGLIFLILPALISFGIILKQNKRLGRGGKERRRRS